MCHTIVITSIRIKNLYLLSLSSITLTKRLFTLIYTYKLSSCLLVVLMVIPLEYYSTVFAFDIELIFPIRLYLFNLKMNQ